MQHLATDWVRKGRSSRDQYTAILGALYVKAVFGEKDREQANILIKNIRQVFDENLNGLEWIDDHSKVEAKKKLEKITEKVGYPDLINNRTKLNERSVFQHDDDDDRSFISVPFV